MMNNEQQSDHVPLADVADDHPQADEPRDERSHVTAYALGELSESEAAEIAIRLRDSADDGQMANELSRLGTLLRKAAVESPLPPCSSELRAAVLAELAKPPVPPPLRLRERFPRRHLWLRLSLAASLAIVCGTLVVLTNTKRAERIVAQAEYIIAMPDAAGDVNAVSEAGEMLEDTETEYLPSGDAELLFSRASSRIVPNQTGQSAAPGLNGALPSVRLQIAAEGEPRDNMQRRAGGKSGGGPRINQIAATGGGFLMSGPGARPTSGRATEQSSQQYGVGPEGAPGDIMGNPLILGARYQEQKLRTLTAQFEMDAAKLEYDYRKRQHERIQGGLASASVEQKVAMDAERQLAEATDRLEAARRTYFSRRRRRLPPLANITPNAESYSPLVENSFRKPTEYPLSTFSIDVDTASYTNARRFLNSHAMPPPDAVRIEELINYFQYAYPPPKGDRPFSVTTDVADCPWNAEHRLLRVALKGREVAADARPAGNLVFLLDVSGSMGAPNKLTLVKEAMHLLAEKLTENDRVAIVTYAGNSGLALPPTNGTDKAAIRDAISNLAAGGSTNGGQGLQMAYDTAQSQFIKGGINRVILATDGDFNVGIVNQDDLVKLVVDKAKHGVYLTALGFGMGNLKDGTLEKLADKGNGNYAYIDTLAEARRVLVEQLSGTLVTIAKDVKLQLEFNPARAASYRLIGYANRIMPPRDFHDDRKDAGEIGAGHTVTAFYEIEPAAAADAQGEGTLKYQTARPRVVAAKPGELATIQLRYKDPDATQSRLIEHVVTDHRPPHAASSVDFQFAAAVAEFGMLLRDSPYRGTASYQSALALAEQGLGNDPHGYRSEFIELVRKARDISGKE